MRFRQSQVKSVAGLLRRLEHHRGDREILWFRGHGEAIWTLLPYLYRLGKSITYETALLKKFKQNALPYLEQRPGNDWEWLFVMQHYGVPTRLLDWTESPLVALYFCVSNPDHDNVDGAIWALAPLDLNKAANVRPEIANDIPDFEDDIFDQYLAAKMQLKASTELNPIAAIALRNNIRMQVQHAVFTVSHKGRTTVETVGDGKHTWCYRIPAASKLAIRNELTSLNYTRMSLFPELASVAATAKEILDD